MRERLETALRMHTEKDLSTTESLFCCIMQTGQKTPIFCIGTMNDLN